MNDGIIGNWIYGASPSTPYGDETTYKKAMEFLDGPYIIEDWGCGTAYAKRFVQRGRYIGIDGSWSFHRDMFADLRTYRSTAGGILIRHILEHNHEWRKILENALASFQHRMVLVMFVPFGDQTRQIAVTRETIPDISFRKEDLMELLRPFNPTEETLRTATQYGWEHIFYLERKK